MSKLNVDFTNTLEWVGNVVETLNSQYTEDVDLIVSVNQGGAVLAGMLAQKLIAPVLPLHKNMKENMSKHTRNVLIVDDLISTGDTMRKALKMVTDILEDGNIIIATMYDSGNAVSDTCMYHVVGAKPLQTSDWIDFWWEVKDEGVSSVQDNITRLLDYIGEDPKREGLLDTPKRVVNSYTKLFGGYNENPEDVMVTFSEGSCKEMVILKDIEFYSTCEHHMIPFMGKASIAYIPNGKVIGVSKLARLLEIFARRLQIQERIGQQVVDELNKHLSPLGAACIIEAQHLCMTARGVEKQKSVMVTSSLSGVFQDEPSARQELMTLLKG